MFNNRSICELGLSSDSESEAEWPIARGQAFASTSTRRLEIRVSRAIRRWSYQQRRNFLIGFVMFLAGLFCLGLLGRKRVITRRPSHTSCPPQPPGPDDFCDVV